MGCTLLFSDVSLHLFTPVYQPEVVPLLTLEFLEQCGAFLQSIGQDSSFLILRFHAVFDSIDIFLKYITKSSSAAIPEV